MPCTIWEACRATAAATSFFEPIQIGPFREKFVDGATGFNNPVNELLAEARDIWPEVLYVQNIGCIVSLGTGFRAHSSFGPSVLKVTKTLIRIALETEKTAEGFHRGYPTLVNNDKYFRFNVPKGLEAIGTSEYEKVNILAACTRSYLAMETTKLQLTKFTSAMRKAEVAADTDLGAHMEIRNRVESPISRVPETAIKTTKAPLSFGESSLEKTRKTNQAGGLISNAPITSRYDQNGSVHNGINPPDIQSFPGFASWMDSFSHVSPPSQKEDRSEANQAKMKSTTVGRPAQSPGAIQTSAAAERLCLRDRAVSNPTRPLDAGNNDHEARHANVKRFVQSRGHPKSDESKSMDQNDPKQSVRPELYDFQEIPLRLKSLVKGTTNNSTAHLIINGVGPHGTATIEHSFPRDASLLSVSDHLKQSGRCENSWYGALHF